MSTEARGLVSLGLQSFITEHPNQNFQLLALRALAVYDASLMVHYLESGSPLLTRAEAALQLCGI